MPRMRTTLLPVVGLVGVLLFSVAGCGDDDGGTVDAAGQSDGGIFVRFAERVLAERRMTVRLVENRNGHFVRPSAST